MTSRNIKEKVREDKDVSAASKTARINEWFVRKELFDKGLEVSPLILYFLIK